MSAARQSTSRSDALEGLAAMVRQHHGLAQAAGETMLTHAIAAGEALIEAKALVPPGEWIAWVVENVPGGSGYWTCLRYMRLAALKESVDPSLSMVANLRLLAGADGRPTGTPQIPEEVKAEALRLHEEGLSAYGIAKEVGVSRSSVRSWISPEWAREKERRRTRPTPSLQIVDPGVQVGRAFKYGEPGRTAVGQAVRQLAQATGKDQTREALLDLAAIATRWAERLGAPLTQTEDERAA